ncbi:hypothetical protein L210DRAFT_798930, partial [Boletus edulis BED1]
EETIRSTPRETQIGYTRPPDVDGPDWEEQNSILERRVVRASQIHSCSVSTCLRFNRHRQMACKRRAPWPLSAEEYVDEAGNWSPKRTYGFMNNFCPAITTTLLCNNDIKLLTNGEDTKDVMWYTTSYATKKQSKNNNVSALMAKAMLYHENNSNHLNSILEQNRLLIFRCQQAINREMELSGPQVMSYIMGYGDCIRSHHYVPFYWFSLQKLLEQTFPELKGAIDAQNTRETTGDVDETSLQQDSILDNAAEHTSSVSCIIKEAVTLEFGKEGGLQTRASQIEDYCFRGTELNNLSYIRFILDTYEEHVPASKRIQRGRPPHKRSSYMLQHPRNNTYTRVIRPPGHNTLPNFVGQFLPSSKDPSQRALHCASMLALLVPWRRIQDIITNEGTWEERYDEFLSRASQEEKDIIAGVDYYYECRTAVMKKTQELENNHESRDEERRQQAE